MAEDQLCTSEAGPTEEEKDSEASGALCTGVCGHPVRTRWRGHLRAPHWRDDDMLTNLTRDWWTPVDLDMCRYNLRAQTDGGLHKKPARLMVSDDSMAAVLKKNCRGDHEHTPTAGRNTKAAGIYTKEFCEAVIRAYRRRDGLWGAEGDKT